MKVSHFLKARNIIWMLSLLWIMASCSVQAPKFQKVSNLKLDASPNGELVLSADADLYNPNKFTVDIREADIQVFIDGSPAGQVQQQTLGQLKKQATSTLPISVRVSLQNSLGGLLNGLVGMITKKDMQVEYKGYIKAKAMGVNFKIPVNANSTVRMGGKK